ncbi:MAG: hypothetical protein V1800_06955 [Candidatus Latescibacterota bacterium]
MVCKLARIGIFAVCLMLINLSTVYGDNAEATAFSDTLIEVIDPLQEIKVCPICISPYRAIAEAIYIDERDSFFDRDSKGIKLYKTLFPDAKREEYETASMTRVQSCLRRMGMDTPLKQIRHHFETHFMLRDLKEQGLLERFSVPPQETVMKFEVVPTDSLYVALKKKTLEEMTEREYEYLLIKEKEKLERDTRPRLQSTEKLQQRASWALTAYAALATLAMLVFAISLAN